MNWYIIASYAYFHNALSQLVKLSIKICIYGGRIYREKYMTETAMINNIEKLVDGSELFTTIF